MKAFIALVCLVAVVVSQEDAEPTPTTTIAADTSSNGPMDPVNCDIENGQIIRLLPDPKSCEKFYICNNGIPILMVCPAGLLFNPKVSLCDWPRHVHCTINEKPTTTPKPSPTAIFNF